MIEQPTAKIIQKAAKLLQQGELVAFPTETVYGLGAAATIPLAVQKIFLAKGRPADHPLIVHLSNSQQLKDWAREIPNIAWQLAEQFWPGPLTLVLPKAPHVSDLITGGQDTVGIRIPGHPVAQALLKAYGHGVVAPSANRFGKVSPTLASHVQAELGEQVAMILDGGPCQVGIESTIVDLSGKHPRILRPGMISATQISQVIGSIETGADLDSPRVSGNLLNHYAPQTPLKIISAEKLKSPQYIPPNNTAVLSFNPLFSQNPTIHWIKMPLEPETYAHILYAKLREIDQLGYEQIFIEEVPNTENWSAIRDRLQKASLK